MWGVTPSNRWDWDALRETISKKGVRNSLLVAPMPTASTSQILGNNECFEPYTSNIYSRRVLRFASPSHVIILSWFITVLLNLLTICLQWWICCCEQTSSSRLDWNGIVVSYNQESDNLWKWFGSKYFRNTWGTEGHIQVWDLWFLNLSKVCLMYAP